jgi:flavorubredoxin/flavin reductase (DIM6/NTAB) family NADH-FMN oxidoreductase RutF
MKEESFESRPPTPPPQTPPSGNSKQEAPPKVPEVETKVYEETLPNSDNIQLSKCVTTQRLKFEVEYALKRGTSDNVYSIEGTEKTALIDVPDKAFAENLFGENKHSSSDFLILQHISPKRLDSISALLENRSDVLPPIEIVVTNPGARVIYDALKPPDGVTPGSNERLIAAWKRPSELSGKPKLRARLRIIRGNEEKLDLGGGRTLTFMPCSTPRWPDVFCTRDSKSGIVFTSKFYSAHVANEQTDENNSHVEMYDSGGLDSFQEDWRYFYDCMLAPMATQVNSALFKLKALAYNSPYKQPRLAPCHGPVLLNSSPELIREYDEWTDKQLKQINDVSVAVIYASAYGNTSAMAQAIARGITKAGVGVEMVNCELTSADEIQELAKTVGGFCLGSPTLGGHVPTPVTDAMGQIVKSYDTDKPAGVFGSFGWSGEAVDIMETRLKNAGFNFAFDAIRCKFKPTEETLQLCEESGTDLAQLVLKKSKQAKKAESKRVQSETFSGVTETEAAVGRIVGSLCAVTAKSGDAQSAMLASWVSQASFNPPALTVAVAKDRAVESFMLPGGTFNLNILKLGNEKETMKALLKGFAPGEDRFGDMKVSYSENNECAIVTDALAYCECSVKSRMECGDHWVVLAEVTGGKLLDEEGKSAMHHRKTGKSY